MSRLRDPGPRRLLRALLVMFAALGLVTAGAFPRPETPTASAGRSDIAYGAISSQSTSGQGTIDFGALFVTYAGGHVERTSSPR